MEVDDKGDYDLMRMSMTGDREVSPLVQTAFSERNGVISPDGHWLAYEADDSGQFDIYVSPYPDVDSSRTLVSAEGGVRPIWSPKGTGLFYVNPSGAVMAVAVSPGPILKASAPVLRVRDGYFTSPGNPGRTYDVSADGERLLVIKDDQQDAPHGFVIAQHWIQELRRLVAAK
jgi:hypothetical protein